MTDKRPHDHNEFYVGYLAKAPPAIAARVRFAVLLLFALTIAVSLMLVFAQGRFAPGVFEFGVIKEFEGVVIERPYPMLLVRRPGLADGSERQSTYSLTAFGKRGAADLVAGLDGTPVGLRGSLVYRDGRTMIEVQEGSVEPLSGQAADELASLQLPPEEDLGTHTLVGEIVDSKCFLGVMKPGELKPHRSCAARCISGGVPPVLLVRGADGTATYLLLVSPDGEPLNDQLLDIIAEPVAVTGRVHRTGDLFVLRADRGSFRRLAS